MATAQKGHRVEAELDDRAYRALEKLAQGSSHSQTIGAALVLAEVLKDAQDRGEAVGIEARQIRRIGCRLL
jgi:hypothetical protein